MDIGHLKTGLECSKMAARFFKEGFGNTKTGVEI
jgi:hypothetical protein